MLSHEFFHEQAHIDCRHELKRHLFLFILCLFVFFIYRFFCHRQEFEADRLAAKKCGKAKAIESLKFLQMREGKVGFWANLLSLHPKTKRRIYYILP
ncbi:MAG: M48 family metalloprotease [Fibromonadaceae bacterium]|jgi:Zn-dependent protease with chaperone function|nr:M48 family metalloprotease [Fibromonadaceae bacterium]